MLSQFPALDVNWQGTLRAQKRAIVFCWAAWSVVHKMQVPVLARVMPDYNSQITVFTADIDDQTLWLFLHLVGVMTIPSLILLQKDVGTELMMGLMDEDALRARLDAWLQK